MFLISSEIKLPAKLQILFWFVFSLILIVIDQLTKLAVRKLGWSIFLNDQFAFSLPIPKLIIFMIYFFVIVGVGYYIFKTWKRFSNQQRLAWSLVLAGGMSNVFERIVSGHVVDFIYLATGVFNLADFFILLGLVLLLVSTRRLQNSENI